MDITINSDILLNAGIIFILIICSAILSGSETALTASSRIRMTRLEHEGSRRARWVNYLMDRKEHLISAILVCNNLVNILASVLATDMFLGIFGETGLVYATLVMTVIVVVFAEVLPKTYAILTPDQTSMRVAGLLRVLVWLLSPLTRLLQLISLQSLRLTGLLKDDENALLAPHEEIRGAIDMHHRDGGVVKTDRDMLGGILDLASITVGEVMVHRKNMFMIDAGLSNAEVIRAILESPYTRIPMWQEHPENIIGIIHAKDFLRALAESTDGAEGVAILNLIKEPWFVPETTPLSEQLSAFRAQNAHIALVIDEYGDLKGLISMEDILEEIVGHIQDEHDEPERNIRRINDNTIEVLGTLSIRDLNREMGWSLPDDEATTIAGLVIHEARIIPDPGQIFNFYGHRFKIMGRQRNQIVSLRITSNPTFKH